MTLPMPERIQKLLAAAGIDSRRNVERLVTEGRVAVNGRVARKLPILVDPEHDSVEVDGEPVKLGGTKRRRVYVLMHKPKGTVCTNKGQRTAVGDQRTAVDLLPPGFDKRVYPVGRLDAASTGLLLLTNDGPLTQQLTHPKFGVPKTYHVACDGHVGDEVIDALRAGVWLGDKERRGTKMKAVKVEVLKRGRERTSLSVVLDEGQNRQIRRMLAKLGHKVKTLRRERLGPLTLGDLKPGQSRLLTPPEVKAIRNAADRGKRPAKPAAG